VKLIEQVCMLDVLIKKACFVSSVSVEGTKANQRSKLRPFWSPWRVKKIFGD